MDYSMLIKWTKSARFMVPALFVAGILAGFVIGMAIPFLLTLLDPNVEPVAALPVDDIRASVGEHVVLNASLSAVSGRPNARLRFEWFDDDGQFVLLPAGIDPESSQARRLDIFGAIPGERHITLRVTNFSRCHIFAKLGLSPERCEKSGEKHVRIAFADSCRAGPGLPPDKLVLQGPLVIGADNHNAECRLILPSLIVTNGFELHIQDEEPVVAAATGTSIVAFQDAPPRSGRGADGQMGANGQAEQAGGTGGMGGSGEPGRPGRNAGLIVIDAPKLSGMLTIENGGQAGGQGGVGGRGGVGGSGGYGASSIVRGSDCDRRAKDGLPGGNGGNGAPGGPGGAGGNGGEVRIKLGEAITAPARLFVRAGAGPGGQGGPGGYLGLAGDGGNPGNNDPPCPPAQKGNAGRPGALGVAGALGPRGTPGVFEMRAGTQAHEGRLGPDEQIRFP